MTATRFRLLFAATLLLLLATWSRTAPVMPSRPLAKGSVLSLAKIEKVNLDIRSIPRMLESEGIRPASVRGKWSQMLQDEGIAVTAKDQFDESVPTLELKVLVGKDEKIPNAVLCYLEVRLNQSARFERLDRELVVPTYVKASATMEAQEDLASAIRTSLRTMLKSFVRDVRKAGRTS